MKICFISPYPPNIGGLSAYTKRSVDSLLKISDWEISVISFNKGSDIFRLLPRLIKYKPSVVRLEYNIPSYGVATIPIFFILLIYKCIGHKKLVINYHEVKRETDLLKGLGILFYHFFSRLFDRIYVHTEEARQILIKKCYLSPKNIRVIPLGFYIFNNKKDYSKQLEKKYNLGSKKVILYLGFIHVDKGIQYLIKAVNYIKNNYPEISKEIKVIIGGDIRPRKGIFRLLERKDCIYKKELLSLKNRLNLDDIVSFIGYVNERYLYSLIKISRLAVLPYLNVEQSGILNMVLPLRKPLIASNISGLEETLKEVGILVPPRDYKKIGESIYKLLTDNRFYNLTISKYSTISKGLEFKIITNQFIQDLKSL